MNNPIYTTDIIKSQLQNLTVCHNYRVYYSLHYSNKNFEAYLDKNTLEFRANNTLQNIFVLLTKDQRINSVLLEIKAVDLDNNSTLVHSSFVVCDNFDSCEPPYPSPTPTPSITPSVTPTISVTPSVTPTISLTPSITPTNSVTPSVTPTLNITPTSTVTPSATPTNTATPSATPANTATPSATPSSSPTPTISLTPSVTPTNLNCVAGSSWSAISLEDRAYRSIAYGNGRFVTIIGGYNQLVTSTDGINWSSVNIPSTQVWTDIAYGNGRFIAISTTNNIGITSTDGLNWNTINLPTIAYSYNVSQYTSITFGNGLFVIAGITVSNNPFGAYSIDGASWTITNLPVWGTPGTNLIRYINGIFINVCYNTSNNYNHYNLSDNGITWTVGSFLGSTGGVSIRDVAFGNSAIVAVGYNRIFRSIDATNWTLINTISANWNSISYGNGKFVVIGDGTNQALTSSDGSTWTVVSLPTNSFWKDITYGTHINKFVAIGSGGAGAISTC